MRESKSEIGRQPFLHHRLHGVLEEVEEVGGEEADVEGGQCCDEQGNSHGGDGAGQFDLALGLLHVHEDDDAEIVVDRDHGVDNTDDNEGNLAGLDGGAEDVKLGHKARGRRYACQREHEDCHGQGGQGFSKAQPLIVCNLEVLLAEFAQGDDNPEGTEIHEGISCKVK